MQTVSVVRGHMGEYKCQQNGHALKEVKKTGKVKCLSGYCYVDEETNIVRVEVRLDNGRVSCCLLQRLSPGDEHSNYIWRKAQGSNTTGC